MRRILGIIAVAFTLMIAIAVPSQAEAPSPSISTNITDKSGSLDKVQMDLLVNQVQAETDYELYVYVTDSFNGMSGAQWAVETANKSNLNSTNAVLFAIATQERKYGSAFPTGSSIASKISTVENATISFLKNADWNGAVAVYGNELIKASHSNAATAAQSNEAVGNAFAGFIGVVGYILIFAVGAITLFFAGKFGAKGVKAYLRTKNSNREKDMTIASLKKSIPSFITTVDNKLNDLNDRLTFASGMYGAKHTAQAEATAQSASSRLQKAISYVGEVNETMNRGETLRQLALADTELQIADKYITNAEATLISLKAQDDEVQSKAENLKNSMSNFVATQKSLQDNIKDMKGAFAPEFLSDAKAQIDAMNSKLDIAVKRMNAVVATSDLAEKKEALAVATQAVNAVENASITASRAVKKASGFASYRDSEIASWTTVMAKNAELNARDDIKDLAEDARVALKSAKAIDCSKGNPAKALADALAPVQAYSRVIAEYKVMADKVSASKSIVLSIIGQKQGEMMTFVSDLNKFAHVVVGAHGSLREDAQDCIEAFDIVKGRIKNLDAYDIVHMETIQNETNKFVAKISKQFGSAIGRIEAEKVAIRQREEAEAARKRKAEADRKKKRQQEEEEARRRRQRSSSSSSSSSYSGYSSSYSSYSSSSSSSFSGSGGSFGDSGSGGSF